METERGVQENASRSGREGLFRRGWKRKKSAVVLLIAAVAASGLLLVAPAAGTANSAHLQLVATSVTLKAPYPGQADTEGLVSGQGCAVVEKFPVSPSFNTSTGIFKSTPNATATSCGSENNTAVALATGGFLPSDQTLTGHSGSAITFTVARSGTYSVTVVWKFQYTVKLTAIPKGTATATAFCEVSGSGQIYDKNTSTYGDYSTKSISNTTTSGTLSGTFGGTVKVVLTASLVAGNVYLVFAYFEAFAGAEVSPGGASAFADLNVATAGNDAKLVSVTIP